MHLRLALVPLALTLATTSAPAQSCSTVYDVNPGQGASDPRDLFSVEGQYVLFTASDGTGLSPNLYRWDAQSGVTPLGSIWQQATFAVPNFLTVPLNGQLQTLFVGESAQQATLFSTDGTPAGTHSMGYEMGGFAGTGILAYQPEQQLVYFNGYTPANGEELWRTDGTPGGTFIVADLFTGFDAGGFANDGNPEFLTPLGSKIIFRGDDGPSKHSAEPWISDGTPTGTYMLADLDPSAPFFASGSYPYSFTEINGKLVFMAKTTAVGTELFVTDGTSAGTTLLMDIFPGTPSSTDTNEVFKEFFEFNGELYFSADDGVHGMELWKTDGTAAGTQLFKDLTAGPAGSMPSHLTSSAGTLYFLAAGGLWATDGTSAGVHFVANAYAGATPPLFTKLAAASNGVYFSAPGPSGQELYFTDGTAAGTQLACDVAPGVGSSHPASLMTSDNHLVFRAEHPSLGTELFSFASPGAYVEELGLSGNGSQLTSTVPLLGANLTLSAEDVPSGSIGAFLMSTSFHDAASPLLAPSSISWIDPLTFTILGLFTSPSASLGLAIPATPGLAGLQVNAQVWAIPPVAFPASTGNGLHLVLGN
jgi:ELWxxDGT repeat protein